MPAIDFIHVGMLLAGLASGWLLHRMNVQPSPNPVPPATVGHGELLAYLLQLLNKLSPVQPSPLPVPSPAPQPPSDQGDIITLLLRLLLNAHLQGGAAKPTAAPPAA